MADEYEGAVIKHYEPTYLMKPKSEDKKYVARLARAAQRPRRHCQRDPCHPALVLPSLSVRGFFALFML